MTQGLSGVARIDAAQQREQNKATREVEAQEKATRNKKATEHQAEVERQQRKIEADTAKKSLEEEQVKQILETPKLTDNKWFKEAIDDFVKVSRSFNRNLKFSVNEDLNQVVVKVYDGYTDKLIKEIPSEEVQRLHMRLKEAVGLLIDEKI